MMNDRQNKPVIPFWCRAMSASALVLLFCTFLSAKEPNASGRKRGLVHALAFSHDGVMLAAGGDSVRIYDVKSGRLVKQWEPPPLTRSLAFLPEAPHVVVEAGDGGKIRFQRLAEDRPFRELKLHTGRAQHVVISPDGKLAASTGAVLIDQRPARGELRIWTIDSGEIVGSVDVDVGAVLRPDFDSDGKFLAFAKATHSRRKRGICSDCGDL
jgi:WD40 repeat protein